MSPEKQRIKIAEACGLKVIDVPFIPSQTKAAGCVFTDAARAEWRRCYLSSCGVKGIPDYLKDLNAMHDAEKKLKLSQWDAYESHLKSITAQAGVYSPIRATAAQRAEAFLRTLSLWTEE